MINRGWMPLAASALIYIAITAFFGRDVLLHLDSTVANDAGDPLFAAAILKWNATHVPLTDAWWQFPIFYPTRDVLAFSEHFLGLSLIASPIYWITGNTLVTYNLVTLLTFPLCALAMYALVYRLSRSAAGAFVGGLAFAFAPYRVSQLSHVQTLAAFSEPLALVGLHAYLETGKRRWLVLYGAAWLSQSATSGYSLVFFSFLIGFWVLWFVVARRQWRALAMIAGTTALAVLPLVPVLYKYVVVHAYHGFERSVFEALVFSADLSSVLCAPDSLSFWGWVRVGCYPEGVTREGRQLFPGIAVLTLCGIHAWRALRRAVLPPSTHRPVVLARRVLFTVAFFSALAVAAVLVHGPWRIDLGFVQASSSSIRKPLLVGIAAVVLAMLLAPRLAAVARLSSTTGFYLLAALVTWLLALGPTIAFMGVPSGVDGPFVWLLALPGVNGLRVPSRFWSIAALCLAIVTGTSLAAMIRGRSLAVARGVVLLAGLGVAADGWIDRIPIQPAPNMAPGAARLAGATVVELPLDAGLLDIAATFRAVEGNWTTVNGYSGYFPSYYYALKNAALAEDGNLLTPLRGAGELHVLVSVDAPGLTALVERQAGVTMIARSASTAEYRLLPRRTLVDPLRALGRRVPVANLLSACAPHQLPLALDGNSRSLWECPPHAERRTLTVDTGEIGAVGAIVHSLGRSPWLVPTILRIDTSEDERAWRDAWNGAPLAEAVRAGKANPADLRIVVAFPQRSARYIRLSGEASAPLFWSIAELEIWSGVQAVP